MAGLVLVPLLLSRPQHGEVVRIVRIEARGKDPLQHRHREKRPGHFDQREPFCMMAFSGHGYLLILSGTRNVTATGNILGCGSAKRALI